VRDHRGITVVEALITALLVGIVAVGFRFAYMATTRAYGDSSSQVALQRQGTLAVEQIARRVRAAGGANPISAGPCNGHDALLVETADGLFCYYADGAAAPDVKLCESSPGGPCRNLLAGGLGRVAILQQPVPPSPHCPEEVAPGAPCFAKAIDVNRAEVAFTLLALEADGTAPPLYGMHVVPFRISLTCSGRNC
jgi:hypothetical protein